MSVCLSHSNDVTKSFCLNSAGYGLFFWKYSSYAINHLFHVEFSFSRYVINTTRPVTHIYASMNWISTGSNSGLSPKRCQAITWTNGDLLPIRPSGTNLRENQMKIRRIHFKNAFEKVVCKMVPILSQFQCVVAELIFHAINRFLCRQVDITDILVHFIAWKWCENIWPSGTFIQDNIVCCQVTIQTNVFEFQFCICAPLPRDKLKIRSEKMGINSKRCGAFLL